MAASRSGIYIASSSKPYSHTYVRQAAYVSNKQCSKQYAAAAPSSVASSSSISTAAQQAALLIPTANTSTTQLLLLYSYAV